MVPDNRSMWMTGVGTVSEGSPWGTFSACCLFHSAPYLCHCSVVQPGGRPPGGKGGVGLGIGEGVGLSGRGKGSASSTMLPDRAGGNYSLLQEITLLLSLLQTRNRGYL